MVNGTVVIGKGRYRRATSAPYLGIAQEKQNDSTKLPKTVLVRKTPLIKIGNDVYMKKRLGKIVTKTSALCRTRAIGFVYAQPCVSAVR